jgi:hypothetical protein
VPLADYDKAKRSERKLKADALDAAKTEEEKTRIPEDAGHSPPNTTT